MQIEERITIDTVADAIEFNKEKIMKPCRKVEIDNNLLLNIAKEECAELIQAISKVQRRTDEKDALWHASVKDADVRGHSKKVGNAINRAEQARSNLAEEIADVFICIEWVKKISGISDNEVNKWILGKSNRISDRVEEGEFY